MNQPVQPNVLSTASHILLKPLANTLLPALLSQQHTFVTSCMFACLASCLLMTAEYSLL